MSDKLKEIEDYIKKNVSVSLVDLDWLINRVKELEPNINWKNRFDELVEISTRLKNRVKELEAELEKLRASQPSDSQSETD